MVDEFASLNLFVLRTLPGSLLESLPRPSPLAQGVWDYSLENTATACRGNCWEKSKRERGPLWETILILSGSGEASVCHGEVSPTRINKEHRDRACERAEGRRQGCGFPRTLTVGEHGASGES